MPARRYFPDPSEYKWVQHFELCKIDAGCDYTPAGEKYIRGVRHDAAALREELLALTKQLGKEGDRAGARVVSNLAKEQMRIYRAACFCLGWYAPGSVLPGDCISKPPSTWPVELASELDLIYATAAINWSI